MDVSALLDKLAYTRSPNFLPAARFGEAGEHAHVFRRALRLREQIRNEHVAIHGVYLLREDPSSQGSTSTPVVYVAEAETERGADEIHNKVWNQDVVPFLLVHLPKGLRLYSGFAYSSADEAKDDYQRGVLESLVTFDRVTEQLSEFQAQLIDNGTLFRKRGTDVDTKSRVDWKLLANLEKLGSWLRRKGLKTHVAHALIGKFIYLKYLHERDILSDRKLTKWGIDIKKVFGRQATVRDTRRLIKFVDCWLNGSIFPIPFYGEFAPTTEHLREVASIFMGDDYVGNDDNTRQLHLDFKAYSFSYIPIETLSVIYEQFLAIEGKNRKVGAYYTPIPLVNFVLAEIEAIHPLGENTRILDPSCGSGAFLVQCYRRLIENAMREQKRDKLKLKDLRELLVNHIYGIDRDPDACQIAAMSLALAMLDNIDPPDLESRPGFRLPSLLGKNLFMGDFFDPESSYCHALGEQCYDWIVGNPPWVEIDRAIQSPIVDHHAARWMREHDSTHPVNGNQVAEAFAWKAADHLASGGTAGLLLPAMTFFKKEPGFRTAFFSKMKTHSIANFANLRRDLFAGRVEAAAAALFYACPVDPPRRPDDILVYSPLLLNQEANRPSVGDGPTKRQHTWTITLGASEIRRVSGRAIATGDSLPFKIAMWGSPRDESLLRSVASQFPKLSTYVESKKKRKIGEDRAPCKMYEGVQIKTFELPEITEKVLAEHKFHPELLNKRFLNSKVLKESERIYALPPSALENLDSNQLYLRRDKGLEVSMPPHILVHGGRNFSVFSDDFIIVRDRDIGISGDRSERNRLIALSVYLNSDFAIYYDFFMSPQQGIRDGRSTLDTLSELPFPFTNFNGAEIEPWLDLHKELVRTSHVRWPEDDAEGSDGNIDELELKLNGMVGDLLGLTESDRWLVHDFVHVRRHLSDGQIGGPAIEPPRKKTTRGTQNELNAYAEVLQHELDDFIGVEMGFHHQVCVIHDSRSGVIQVNLRPLKNGQFPVEVHRAEDPVARKLAKIRERLYEKHPQWIHFDRNLFIYEGTNVFILKPMQRVHWLKSQALIDADEIIAETLIAEDTE